ncbi:MAG TPA: sulfate reduction electron transfer complex DsrMKJOP subunit DsrM [Candidatus Acidoferrum sp.]|nr:sulfate reduction electron transfer complex DsrMKJOP subunit DsrM [Candidatus Acidoferrum sp.]
MNVLYSLIAVLLLVLVGAVAGRGDTGRAFIAVAVPYAALAIFLAGFCYRILRWAWTPVPFRIPTTCGQQKSLPWIKASSVDNPSTGWGVLARMSLEVLAFRSLFRNNQARLHKDRLVFSENKYLWLGALAFHWSLLIILLRHLRLLVEPVPAFVLALQRADGFFQITTPDLYASDVILLGALAYLLFRRLRDPLVRYISLFTDYLALFLLLGIAVSGVLMRYFLRADITSVKQFALGLATFHPIAPPALSSVVLVHVLLVSALAAYFPFSKLMHWGGVLLSPTRNLANNNRSKRHVNPWNYPVKTHTYAEWEEEFHDKIKAAGIPLEAEDAGKTSAN